MSKYNFKLTISYANLKMEDFRIDGYDEIYGDSLIELLSKFLIVITGIKTKIMKDNNLIAPKTKSSIYVLNF